MVSSTFYFFAMMLSVAFGQTCIREANNARADAGRQALRYDVKLENAARFHNDWMLANSCFSHQCPGEPPMGDRVTNAGYAWWGLGEILASTGGDCERAVYLWLGSEGHRNILLGDSQDIGCAHGGNYFTCVLGVPRTLEIKTNDMNSNNITLSYQVIYRE